jgi:alpha-L-arabinofuranosidase
MGRGAMNRELGSQRSRWGRRSSEGLAPAVSVLRWPAGRSSGDVFEMFSARESDRFGPRASEPSAEQENVLLVSASRRAAPETPAVRLSFVNTSPSQAVKLSVKLAGRTPHALTGSVLTVPSLTADAIVDAAPAAEPTAEPAAFHGAVLKGKVVEITVPARSLVVLTVQ